MIKDNELCSPGPTLYSKFVGILKEMKECNCNSTRRSHVSLLRLLILLSEFKKGRKR